MASVASVMSEDQFQCSICLDVFTEPVSIPCGHNFCKVCITRHWEGKQQCQCPLCNEKFSKELKLCVNTAFRDVVESFKNHHQQTCCDTSHFLVKPGQVPCDCCLDNKFRASKTCLVCLASYCEMHLELHQRVDALKRHTLTDPVQNLEEKICKKHNRILDLFCRNDLTCVCVLCTDHSDHDTVPLDRAFVNKKGHVGKKIEAKRKSGKKAQKTKATVQPKRKDEATPIIVESNQMKAPNIWGFPSEGPHNFRRSSYVPGTRGFPQRGFCYDIQVKMTPCWHLGVLTESMSGSTFTPIPVDGHWAISLENNNNCKARQNGPVHLYLIKAPDRVLVFLDHESELVSSYDPDTGVLIYSLTGYNFTQRIILLFSSHTVCDCMSVSWAQRLQKKVQKAYSQLSRDSIYIIGLVCLVFCIHVYMYVHTTLQK